MSHGASFPSRLVRLIEPFGTGGGPDIVARRVAEELSEMWGWPVAVENHPGAGSTAAPTLVAQAAGDGHTLLVNTSAHAYSAAFASQLPYDPLTDFVPVAALTTQPYVLIAGAWSQITTLGELVETAKASPGEVRFASTGLGTASHLAVEKLTRDAAINTVHMPAGPSESIKEVVAGVVAGRATFVLSPISIALSHIRTGDVVALGVSTPRRSRSLPDVPTLAEAGIPAFDFAIWYGVWAPAETPEPIVDKLAVDIETAVASSAVSDWLIRHDADPMTLTRAEFAALVRSESEMAAELLGTA